MKMNEIPQEFFEVSDDDNWIPCLFCGQKKLVQIRKAKFDCENCGQEYIADEEDMRESK